MYALMQASEYDLLFKAAVNGFEKNLEGIKEEFSKLSKAKGSDVLSISVDGKPLESSSGYLEWWEIFRNSFDTTKGSGQKVRCFITGNLTEPVKTVPPVQGLVAVGGHTKGDSFICFDKDAYQSYGFEQAANAAVSEEAVTAVNAALTKLLKDSPPPLAGAKNIHWFSEQTENDVTEMPDFGFDISDNEADSSEQPEEDEQRVRKMFTALMNNSLPDMPKNGKLAERIKNELSGISSQIVFAVMHNTPLPDSVAARALAYIRSNILSDSNEEGSPDKTACQILKAWLNRRYRKQNKEEFIIMDKLNSQSPSAAYQTGRLIAEYAALQTDALGDVNAGIVERYYTSACASPAPVMGKLSTMSQYHLSKLKSDKKWLYDIHCQAIEEISCKIGEAIPKRFSLEQQSEFALGYYFQCKVLFEAVLNMYEHDRSASKGEMAVVSPLIIFKHIGTDSNNEQRARQAKLGCSPAHKLFELVTVKKKDGVELPRNYTDYDFNVKISSVPDGVQIGFLDSPYDDIVWDKLPDNSVMQEI